MSCGCDKKRGPVHRTDEATWEQGDYLDTGVLHGKYFPRRQVHALSLAAGATRKVATLSDVRQEMHIHVLSGILSMWWEGSAWSGDTSDQVHMTWSTGNNAPIKLPPGEHRMRFYADNSAAVVATVTILEVEAHTDD